MPPPSECPTIGRAGHVEGLEQVAHAAGVGAERVVAERLGRLAVTEQVGGDHVVTLGERRHHVLPGARAPRQAVEQHDRRPAGRRGGTRPGGRGSSRAGCGTARPYLDDAPPVTVIPRVAGRELRHTGVVADPTSLSDRQYADLLAFRVALRRFLHWSEQAAEAEGLTPAQHQLLLAVRGHAESQGPTVSDVAGYLLVRHHSAVGLIDRAEAMGLVARRADADDHRVVRVRLTATWPPTPRRADDQPPRGAAARPTGAARVARRGPGLTTDQAPPTRRRPIQPGSRRSARSASRRARSRSPRVQMPTSRPSSRTGTWSTPSSTIRVQHVDRRVVRRDDRRRGPSTSSPRLAVGRGSSRSARVTTPRQRPSSSTTG